MKKKILIIDWPSFGIKTVKRLLPQMGYETDIFEIPHESRETRNGEELGGKLVSRIMEWGADAVFSFNYFPVVATAVHACRIKYISWVYDNPSSQIYSMTIFFPGNHIFHFDSGEVERMRAEGVEHVYYMSLGANTEDYDRMQPGEREWSRYRADIAMIGSLYREERLQRLEELSKKDPYTGGYLDALTAVQEQIYGVDIIKDALTPAVMERVMKVIPFPTERGDGYDTPEWMFADYYLATKVTAMEREHLLRMLSEQYEVALYTPRKTPFLEKVKNRGSVDYYDEAPYAMKCARINLNITLRGIHRGIPLRAIDIMACGGFLLSNYQSDLCEDFDDGEDFVSYESPEDAADKAAYYLEHEEERQRIAGNGYRKVKEKNDYRSKLRQILSVLS